MSAPSIPLLLRLYLIRHGETEWSHSGRHTGLTDIPLAQAQDFPLGTASLSIFSFDPQHPDVPVIALWHAATPKAFKPAPK